jgi:hypothetical protein
MGKQVLVARLVGAGLDLLGDVGLERLGPGKAAREAQAGDDAAAVGLGGEVVGDGRRVRVSCCSIRPGRTDRRRSVRRVSKVRTT